jgi:hypothetical protein
MKMHHTPVRRAAWLTLAAPALLATPAFAQDAPTPPPPVSVTVPQAPPPAAPPAPVAAPATPTQSRTTIAPGAADVVDDARIEAAREARTAPVRRTVRATPARAVPARQTPIAPVAAAPAIAPVATAPAPVVAAPAPIPADVAPAPAAVADASAEPATTTTTTSTTEDSGAPLWPIALIVALIVGAGAFFLMRRRRADADEDVYVEDAPYEAEPAYVAPVAAAAVEGTADDMVVADAPADDVAALTDGTAPVRDRPWLEFAMRPVRAGTSADEALVEIELTVANAGNVEAHDVRVSTFMLTDAHASEMERMMVDAPADAGIAPVSIAPGEGTRIDATLAALKSDLGSDGHFNPIVVAEARYRLADGTEGRTSASFVVGVSDADGGAMTGIDLADGGMREDVEAQLHGAVERA